MARVRSPAYPSVSLPVAIEHIRKIYSLEGQNDIDRGSFAQLLGYKGLSGPSATLMSSLSKYGLTEKTGSGEIKVSKLAIDILYGDPEERNAAIWTAANSPLLFEEINKKWPTRQPSPENLKNYLGRLGYSVKILDQVIATYQDTMELVPDDQERQSNSDENGLQNEPEAVITPAKSGEGFFGFGVKKKHQPTEGQQVPFEISLVGSQSSGTSVTGRFTLYDKKSVENLIKILEANKALLPDSIETMQGSEGSDSE